MSESPPLKNDAAGVEISALFGLWNNPASAPRDVVILGFFEDIGWHACAWSDVREGWILARCTSTFPLRNVPDRELSEHAEPKWISIPEHHEDMCWWMPMPPSLHPRHNQPNVSSQPPGAGD